MFVHVRCSVVSIPCSSCVNPARSSERSLVVPPAPQVTLIASGFSATMRAIRDTRFSNPCKEKARTDERSRLPWVRVGLHLVRLGREELERVEEPARVMLCDSVRQLHRCDFLCQAKKMKEAKTTCAAKWSRDRCQGMLARDAAPSRIPFTPWVRALNLCLRLSNLRVPQTTPKYPQTPISLSGTASTSPITASPAAANIALRLPIADRHHLFLVLRPTCLRLRP